MKAETLNKKATALVERELKWDAKASQAMQYPTNWKSHDHAKAMADKARNQLEELLQSVTKDLFDESSIGPELCICWEDWQGVA